MKRIGLVGVGNISEKAYMPIIREHKEITWVVHSRKRERLEALMQQYDLTEGYTSFEELIASDLDACFIQSPTSVHYQQIKMLLEANIHVFVDKPVSDNIEQTRELYALAKSKDLLLFVGFNRRYAPQIAKLKVDVDNSYVTTAKHRQNAPKESRFSIYDLVIHPLDTAVYLLSSSQVEIKSIQFKEVQGQLERLVVHIGNDTNGAQVSANFKAGTNREIVEIANQTQTAVVEDLDRLTLYRGQRKIEEKFADWDTTLYKRGFVSMLEAFLAALENKRLPASQVQTLLSHELCEQIALYIEDKRH